MLLIPLPITTDKRLQKDLTQFKWIHLYAPEASGNNIKRWFMTLYKTGFRTSKCRMWYMIYFFCTLHTVKFHWQIQNFHNFSFTCLSQAIYFVLQDRKKIASWRIYHLINLAEGAPGSDWLSVFPIACQDRTSVGSIVFCHCTSLGTSNSILIKFQ